MVTFVPPSTTPLFGLTLLMIGALYVKAPVLVIAVPPAGVTDTSLAPTVFAGTVTITRVFYMRFTFVATAVPNLTTGVPVVPNPRPSIVTVAPPWVQSTAGVIFVISGGAGTK